MQIRKPQNNKPPRIIIAGEEGVGKTEFGVSPANSLIMSIEDRVDHIERPFDVVDVGSWKSAMDSARWLINNQHSYKNLCIDSIDWLEQKCHAQIIGGSGMDINRVNGGYGAGLREAEKLHRDFIEVLDRIRNEKNMSIICTAHVEVKEEKNPDLPDDFDSFQIKLDKRTSGLWREWADAIIFARHRTFVNKNEKQGHKKVRAFTDGTRVLYTSNQPFFRAKNHYGLPAEMDFTLQAWKELEPYFNKGVDQNAMAGNVMKEIIDLTALIKDEETQKIVMEATEKAGNDLNELNPILERLREITNKGA